MFTKTIHAPIPSRRTMPHDGEHLVDKLIRHGLMKQIAHRVHKDAAWLFPVERLVKAIVVQPYVSELARTLLNFSGMNDPYRVLAIRPRKNPLGVAVLAALRDLGAACYRVPGSIGPSYS